MPAPKSSTTSSTRCVLRALPDAGPHALGRIVYATDLQAPWPCRRVRCAIRERLPCLSPGMAARINTCHRHGMHSRETGSDTLGCSSMQCLPSQLLVCNEQILGGAMILLIYWKSALALRYALVTKCFKCGRH